MNVAHKHDKKGPKDKGRHHVGDASSSSGHADSSTPMTNKDYEREMRRLHGELVALQEWGTEARARLGDVTPEITESRYYKLADVPDAEAWPGVIYVLRLRIARGVYKKTYEGAARPTGAAAGVGNEIEVRRNATDDPEYVPPRP